MFTVKTSKIDAEPDIIVEINISTEGAGGYRADCTAYTVREVVGDDGVVVRQQKKVFSYENKYNGVTTPYLHKTLLTMAADYLNEKGYGGLVKVTGNQASSITQFSGTGITRYNTVRSVLYLSPYSSYLAEQAAKAEYVSYRIEDIPERNRQLDEYRKQYNKEQEQKGLYGRCFAIHKEAVSVG